MEQWKDGVQSVGSKNTHTARSERACEFRSQLQDALSLFGCLLTISRFFASDVDDKQMHMLHRHIDTNADSRVGMIAHKMAEQRETG